MYQFELISSEAVNPKRSKGKYLLLGLAGLFLMSILIGCSSTIHHMGSHVMPFDLDKTLHIFEMTTNGGIQDVVLRDESDEDQLILIRQHLQEEAARFSRGDFSDPKTLHGNNMPGIKELEAGASEVSITYEELSDGARIVYETSDIRLITAIHSWFGAQLSDHGSDSTYR